MKELKCDCCWKVSSDTVGWLLFNFKHLKATWVCRECQPEWKAHMEKLLVSRL